MYGYHPSGSQDSYYSGPSGASTPLTPDASSKTRDVHPTGSHRIVVGVDFGTTFSGVSWAHTANPSQINIITQWPGGTNLTSPKVPSKIAYGANGTVLGWGFQIKPFQQCIECFKLLLDPSQPRPSFATNPNIDTQLHDLGITVKDVVEDYLRLIYDHTLQTLTRGHGQAFMDTTKLEFILTCPAVWSDKSKAATLQAAERTGMAKNYRIRLISEPEAAATYTLTTMQPGQLKQGDVFCVCDAGGGTVDLISYTILGLNPLRIKEAVTGTGGLCGSAYLNRRFEDFIANKLGRPIYSRLKEKSKLASMKTWEEYIKRVFVDNDDEDDNAFAVQIPGVPDDEEKGIEGGFLSLTREEVREIFEPILQDIIQLVDDQMVEVNKRGKTTKAILLVGGFGGSEYLFKRFNEKYKSDPRHANLDILQPIDAWTAVVRGAVARGLETSSLVYTRKSRFHYGIHYMDFWNESIHLPRHKLWDVTRGQFFADDQARWYIKKGQEVTEDVAIIFEFNRVFREGSSYVVTDTLLSCPIEVPPPYITDTVTRVCKLRSDLSSVPRSLFTKKINNNGEEYFRLDFTLEMTIESASLLFELKVNGIKYGEVTTDFA